MFLVTNENMGLCLYITELIHLVFYLVFLLVGSWQQKGYRSDLSEIFRLFKKIQLEINDPYSKLPLQGNGMGAISKTRIEIKEGRKEQRKEERKKGMKKQLEKERKKNKETINCWAPTIQCKSFVNINIQACMEKLTNKVNLLLASAATKKWKNKKLLLKTKIAYFYKHIKVL